MNTSPYISANYIRNYCEFMELHSPCYFPLFHAWSEDVVAVSPEPRRPPEEWPWYFLSHAGSSTELLATNLARLPARLPAIFPSEDEMPRFLASMDTLKTGLQLNTVIEEAHYPPAVPPRHSRFLTDPDDISGSVEYFLSTCQTREEQRRRAELKYRETDFHPAWALVLAQMRRADKAPDAAEPAFRYVDAETRERIIVDDRFYALRGLFPEESRRFARQLARERLAQDPVLAPLAAVDAEETAPLYQEVARRCLQRDEPMRALAHLRNAAHEATTYEGLTPALLVEVRDLYEKLDPGSIGVQLLDFAIKLLESGRVYR